MKCTGVAKQNCPDVGTTRTGISRDSKETAGRDSSGAHRSRPQPFRHAVTLHGAWALELFCVLQSKKFKFSCDVKGNCVSHSQMWFHRTTQHATQRTTQHLSCNPGKGRERGRERGERFLGVAYPPEADMCLHTFRVFPFPRSLRSLKDPR